MNTKTLRQLLAIMATTLVTPAAFAQLTAVSVTGTSYTQNFDGMTNASVSTVPSGWGFFRSGTSAVTVSYSSGSNSTASTQTAGSAGTAPTTGGAYLWVTGTAASGTDKSIGFLSSGSYPGGTGSLAILFGFTNNSGGVITTLDVAWDFEKYRSGTRALDWQFFTSTDGSTWTANSSGNQSYASDANNTTMSNPPLVSSKSFSIPSLNVASGSNYYLRWSYVGAGGFTSGQGLGVDNFSMNATITAVSSNSYWDGGAGWTATAPGAGGNGTWADGSGAWNSANVANFGGTAGSVTAGTVTAAAGMAFATSGYTLSGGTISLTGASGGINSITTPVTTTINSVLAGSSGVTKLGSGTLVLGGVNTFTGTFSISAGTLEIAADSALGDPTTDVSLGGTLKTTTSLTAGAGRDFTGSGTLDIAPGTTLTASGAVNLAATTLSNAGTLDLQGATRSLGSLTFGTAATVNGSGAISLTGITATAVTSGTAIINPAITFSSGDKTVSVGAGGTVLLSGDIAGTTGRIVTNGAGRLVVSGSTSAIGYNIGTTSATPVNGGTVVLGQTASSGTGQTFFNYGTIEAATPISTLAGLSIGGREGTAAVLNGSPITFSGSSRFFSGFGATGALRLDVNNATTFAGDFGPTGGTLGTFAGITLGGTGSMTVNGNAALLADAITLADLLAFRVNGTLGSATSSLTASAGTLIGGTGTINGAVQVLGGGILSAGLASTPGTLTIANALTGTSTSVFNFDLSATDQTVGGGINDLVTGITNLTLAGVLNVSAIGDFSTVTAGTVWRLFNYSGTLTDNVLTLGSMPTLSGGASFVIDTSTPGQVNLAVVPEPTSLALAGLGLAAAGWAARRRRRAA